MECAIAARDTPRMADDDLFPPNTIRRWRKFRDMTLEEVAEATGLTPSFLSLIERRLSDFSGDSLDRIAKALNCERGDLLHRDPKDPRGLTPAQRKRLADLLDAADTD
jgi:transcriptional regulator with XRE-family HTH domain